MVRFYKFICATVCGALALGSAHAGELPDPQSPNYRELPLMVDETGTIYSKVSTTRTRFNGRTEVNDTMDSQVRYDFKWNPETEAFAVRKTNLSFTPVQGVTTGAAAEQNEMTAFFKKLGDISYSADGSFTPLQIDNWPQFRNTLKETLASATDGDNASGNTAFEQVYGSMTAETAAPLFLELETYKSIPHNIGLEIGKPLTETTTVTIPLGNFPVEAMTSLTLTHWDEASNSARLHYIYAPTPEALGQFLRVQLPQILRQAGTPDDVIKETETELAARSVSDLLDARTECHYDMAIDTGLIRHGECTKRIHFNMMGESNTRTDKWTFAESFNP